MATKEARMKNKGRSDSTFYLVYKFLGYVAAMNRMALSGISLFLTSRSRRTGAVATTRRRRRRNPTVVFARRGLRLSARFETIARNPPVELVEFVKHSEKNAIAKRELRLSSLRLSRGLETTVGIPCQVANFLLKIF
jgi:hypothetical protein